MSLAIPTEHDLINYAKAYMGSYLGIIEKEHPDSVPPLARNAPYDIEVCLLPNGCFCMLFQKSNKENIIVTEHDYDYVEKKIASGLDYLVSVYAHEGASVSDAIKRGKKDAINDIRNMESNEIVQASLHLERIVDELTDVAMANRASLKSVASQISKLTPIKESVKRGVPHTDMMRIIQPLRNYPTKPVEIKLDIPDRELIKQFSEQLSNASHLISQIEAQEKLIEELEERINNAYDTLVSKVDEKIDRGLSHIMSASDKRLDEGLRQIEEKSGGTENERIREVSEQINELRDSVSAVSQRSSSLMSDILIDSLTSDLSEIKEQFGDFQNRIRAIEDYLTKLSSVLQKRAI